MSLKKTNGFGLKKGKYITYKAKYLYINLTQMTENVHRKIIVKDQWTAILANFVRK